MEELKKLELKQELFNKNKVGFFYDSLNKQFINLEFQALDLNLFNKLNNKTILNHSNSNNKINRLIDSFKNGNKVSLWGF